MKIQNSAMVIILLFPSVKGYPKGGVGERKHPDISEYVTPLVEGNQPLFRLSEGVPEGRGGSQELTPICIRLLTLFQLTEYLTSNMQYRVERFP